MKNKFNEFKDWMSFVLILLLFLVFTVGGDILSWKFYKLFMNKLFPGITTKSLIIIDVIICLIVMAIFGFIYFIFSKNDKSDDSK